MLDAILRPLIDPPLDRLGRALAARGATADAVTAAGLVLGLVAAGLVTAGAFLAALAPLLLGRLADGLDGAVARATRRTDWGGYWDIFADFVVYAAIPLAFVIHDPAANGLAGAFLLATFYVNAASFFGFAIVAERRGLSTTARGAKSFFHAGGLVEGSETIAFLVLVCLLPSAFPMLATGFGLLCLATAVLRLVRARAAHRDGSPDGTA